MECFNTKFKEQTYVDFAKSIMKEFKNSGKENIVIVNIGTDKCIGDVVAPLVGTLMKGKCRNIQIYGDLHEPVHALNIEDKLDFIRDKHTNDFIIGIDACLGDDEDIGFIKTRDFAISPGKGVGKKLPKVGDMSIIAIISSSEGAEFFFQRQVRLSFVYEMSQHIVRILEEVDNSLTKAIPFRRFTNHITTEEKEIV